jgi:hypothetical protein
LEIILKMNKPDLSELIAALKGGHPKMRDANQQNSGTSMVPATQRLWMLGLSKWKITYMTPILDGI